MTKVLHVIDSGGLYGAEKVLLNCVEEQIRLGCQPTIGSIGNLDTDDKPLEAEARRRGFPVVPFRMRRGLNLAGALRIARYARRNGFEIVHSHGYKGNVLLGLLPRSIRRTPMVSTLHGWTGQQRVGRMALYQWLDRQALRFVDRVVVVSESMLQLDGIRNLTRVSVVRNGIAIDHAPVARPRDAAGTDRFLIGSAGRLSAEKGYPFLIDALAAVRQGGLDAHLIIVGEGAERRPLEQLIAQRGLTGFVQLPGFRTDMQAFLREIDVFVLSSLTEGAPMSVLEAMHAGTPVIATHVGGIPEMLEQGAAGLLVRSGQPAELAEAITSTCRNRTETRHRTERAHDRVRSCYSSTVMAQGYCDLYEKIGGVQMTTPVRRQNAGRP